MNNLFGIPMACLALVSRGPYRLLGRCRNYACLEEEQQEDGSTRTVRGFFCRQHKKHKSTGRAALRSRICVGALGAHLELTPWQAYWVEELLSTGYVEIRREDVERMEERNKETRRPLAYLFLLFARHVPGFHRSWAPELWKQSVARLWRLRQAYGPIHITNNDIRTLICVKGDMDSWIQGMCAYPEFGTIDEHQIGYTAPDFYRFFDVNLTLPAKPFRAWMEEWVLQPADEIEKGRKIAAAKASSAVIRSLFDSKEYSAWRAFEKREWYERQKLRIEPIKEDIIATGWHPDRFLDWCLDVEEKEDLARNWLLEKA
jgi:hypothetical protein